MFNRFHKNKYNEGLTLIELIVVMAIFLILLGITIFDYVGFKSSVALNNLADDIALSVRKTQGYAIGAKSTASSFTNAYGIHFTSNPTQTDNLSGSDKSFIIFADMNDVNGYNDVGGGSFNCSVAYPSVGGNECIEKIAIKSDAKITQIKINGSPMSSNGSLDIMFKRPNPDAYFCSKSSSSNSSCDSNNISNVVITVSGTTGRDGIPKTKNITITNTGLISIQ